MNNNEYLSPDIVIFAQHSEFFFTVKLLQHLLKKREVCREEENHSRALSYKMRERERKRR